MNRLSTLAYDNNGNTTSEINSTGTTNYAWDFENRLKQVTLPNSGGTVSFLYDPFGRRIEKISPAATSIFLYDGDNLVETVSAGGGEVASYAQGQNIDQPLAMDRSGTIDYYEQDGLGSVTSLTASNGSLSQSYTYDSFGNTTNSSGSLTNFFRHTDREVDTETSLYYYRARYYDPTNGRFIIEDPVKFHGGHDFYVYALSDPQNMVDPFGLWPGPGDIWNWLKTAKNTWKTAKNIANTVSCYSTYYYCISTTFANNKSINTAANNNVANTETNNDYANPQFSQGLRNVRMCVAGNPDCDKELTDCLSGIPAIGMFP